MNARPALFDNAVRRSIEDEIERLVSLLDFVDADADAEPSLGWTERGPSALSADFRSDDLELDTADDEAGGDSEPEETDCNLAGARSDLEHDDCDREYSDWEVGQ